jgi:hypothetical protein
MKIIISKSCTCKGRELLLADLALISLVGISAVEGVRAFAGPHLVFWNLQDFRTKPLFAG